MPAALTNGYSAAFVGAAIVAAAGAALAVLTLRVPHAAAPGGDAERELVTA